MIRATTALWLLALLATGQAVRAQSGRPAPATPPSGRPLAASHVADVQAVRRRLGLLSEYASPPGLSALKVAILDYGFEGIASGRPYLPASTVVVEHYDPAFVRRFALGDPDYRKPFEPGNRHGRLMAEIVWAVTGASPSGPTFYLLNANGPTMLRRAVRYAITQRVDVILFSGSFEGGGNGDGGGPINQVVDEAVAAGILWINSAGNFGDLVYNGPVRVLSDGFLRLRDGSDVASLRFRNRVDENTVTVTLTWNDYRDEEDAGTDKDLDLYVEDWAGRRVGASEKVQISGSKAAGTKESRNPRERVVLVGLAATPEVSNDPDYTYRIRIRAKRGKFTARDRLRVLVTASRDIYLPPGADAPRPAFEFIDASGEGELYPPADHPLALTVGDTEPSSSVGPTLDGRIKPDAILVDSRSYFSDGDVTAGSSNAAAYLAGVAALLRATEPALRPTHLRLLARDGPLLAQSAAAGRSPVAISSAATSPPPVGSSGIPQASRSLGGSVASAAENRKKAAASLHVWQTPSRSRLAEVVRRGR